MASKEQIIAAAQAIDEEVLRSRGWTERQIGAAIREVREPSGTALTMSRVALEEAERMGAMLTKPAHRSPSVAEAARGLLNSALLVDQQLEDGGVTASAHGKLAKACEEVKRALAEMEDSQ